MTPAEGQELLEEMTPQSGRRIQESGEIVNIADAYYEEEGVMKLRTSGGGLASNVTKDQGTDEITNGDFETWTEIEAPDDFTFLNDTPTATQSRVEKDTTTVHAGSAALRVLTTNEGDSFPGFGNFVFIKGAVDLSVTANTYGITAWLTREAAKSAYFILFLNCNVGGSDYEYNFTGANAGTWTIQGGGPGAGSLTVLTDTEIGTSYTQALSLSGIAGAPATATNISVSIGSANGTLGGGQADFFVDDMEVFDEAAPGVNLLTNGDFELWTPYISQADGWTSQVGNFNASTDALLAQESTEVVTGSFSADLVSGVGGGEDQALMLWEEMTVDTAQDFAYSLFTKPAAAYVDTTKLFFVQGNPDLRNNDTALYGYDFAYNFLTQDWDDVTQSVAWVIGQTYLDDGTNYNGGTFYAPGGADAIEEIVISEQPLGVTTDLGTSNLNWALVSTIVGGAYAGLNITVIYVSDNFADSSALETYLVTELGASSLTIDAFYDDPDDGFRVRSDLGGDYIGYNTNTPGGTTVTGDSPSLVYQDGFRHGVPGGDYVLELSQDSDKFTLTQGMITAFTGITGDISAVVSSPTDSGSSVYVDRVAFTEITNTTEVTVYDFTSDVDPANFTDGDKILDFGLVGGISALSLDKDGAVGSELLEAVDFTGLPIVQSAVLAAVGVELTERLASISDVDVTSTGISPLYTPAADELFVATRIILRTTELTGSGSDADVSIGTDDGVHTNIAASLTPSNDTNSVLTGAIDANVPVSIEAEPVKLNVNTASTYTTQSVRVYLFGYFLDAIQ